MTTTINPSSPFKNENVAEKNTAADFSIHTMKDDLASLQQGGVLISADQSVSTTETMKTDPIPAPSNNSIVEPIQPRELPKTDNPFTQKAQDAKPVATPFTNSAPFDTSVEKNEKPLTEIPVLEKKQSTTTGVAYKVVSSFAVVLVLTIVALGGYYFWMTNNEQKESAPQEVATETPIIEPAVEDVPVVIAPVEKYSLSTPNYLVVDLATQDADEIKQTITATATELKSQSKPGLYEFTLVDKNNNPVAFPIFATASKINFSPALLSSLDKNFSLFVYNDTKEVRLGIAIKILKNASLVSELKKQEKTLSKDLSLLFLDNNMENKVGTFNVTTYNNTTMHYLNDTDTNKNLSIDYAIVSSQLVIGTSKETGRSLVDRLLKTVIVPEDETATIAIPTDEASGTVN